MVSAIIPAYNEAKRIVNTVERTLPHVDRVIVIDDGSQDTTYDTLQHIVNQKLTVLRHRVNLGKGSTLKTGCEAARRLDTDIIVMLDADGQHPPEHIPAMIDYLKKEKLDVVFSVREGGDRMPLIRRLGNQTLNHVAALLFNIKLQDIWCGFRALRTEVLPRIAWSKRDYSGEIEMALKAGRNGLHHGEYIIPTVYHDTAKGVHMLHGLKLLGQMLIWRITL